MRGLPRIAPSGCGPLGPRFAHALAATVAGTAQFQALRPSLRSRWSPLGHRRAYVVLNLQTHEWSVLPFPPTVNKYVFCACDPSRVRPGKSVSLQGEARSTAPHEGLSPPGRIQRRRRKMSSRSEVVTGLMSQSSAIAALHGPRPSPDAIPFSRTRWEHSNLSSTMSISRGGGRIDTGWGRTIWYRPSARR